MKISAKTRFVNLPVDGTHYKVHGILQLLFAGAFYFLDNGLMPPTFFWTVFLLMTSGGLYTFSRYLNVSELLSGLSRSNTFTTTIDWIQQRKKDKDSFYLGKGYIWGTECTQIYHQLQNLPVLEQIVNLEPRGGGKIFLHNIGREKETNRFMSLPEHTIIAGTTGVGKTQTMKLLISQAVRQGDAVMIIDPKGDRSLLDGIYKCAASSGRKEDFQFFSLLHPNSSLSFDLFADCTRPDEIADRIQNVIAITGGAETSDPFVAFCWGLIHAAADLLLITNEKVTPKRLYRTLVIDRLELYSIAELLYNKSSSETQKRALASCMEHYKAKVIDHDQTHSDKMTSVLQPLLTVLGKGEVGTMLSPEVAHIQLADVINNKRIVYVYLASMTLQRSAATVGKLIVQQIVGHVGKEYGFSRKLNGVHLFVDEFYSVAFPGYIEILAKARAAGLNMYLGMQTSADIAAALGKTGCEQVIGNTANYICHRLPEKFFAEVIADRCGEVAVPQLIKTRSINAGMDKADHLFKSGSSERMDMQTVLRVSPEMLTSLPKGEAFLISSGTMPVKLTLPLLEDTADDVESFFAMLNPELPFELDMGLLDHLEKGKGQGSEEASGLQTQ